MMAVPTPLQSWLTWQMRVSHLSPAYCSKQAHLQSGSKGPNTSRVWGASQSSSTVQYRLRHPWGSVPPGPYPALQMQEHGVAGWFA